MLGGDAEMTVRVAEAVAAAGATMFRGGAYKPRSDPRAELLDVRDLDAVLAVGDVVLWIRRVARREGRRIG